MTKYTEFCKLRDDRDQRYTERQAFDMATAASALAGASIDTMAFRHILAEYVRVPSVDRTALVAHIDAWGAEQREAGKAEAGKALLEAVDGLKADAHQAKPAMLYFNQSLTAHEQRVKNQRDRMAKHFAARKPTPATADFDLPEQSDAIEAQQAEAPKAGVVLYVRQMDLDDERDSLIAAKGEPDGLWTIPYAAPVPASAPVDEREAIAALEQIMRPYGVYDTAFKHAGPLQADFMYVGNQARAALAAKGGDTK